MDQAPQLFREHLRAAVGDVPIAVELARSTCFVLHEKHIITDAEFNSVVHVRL